MGIIIFIIDFIIIIIISSQIYILRRGKNFKEPDPNILFFTFGGGAFCLKVLYGNKYMYQIETNLFLKYIFYLF